jgi:protein ImuB
MLWLSFCFYQLPLDVFCLDVIDTNNTSPDEPYELAIVDLGKLAYCNPLAVSKGIEPGMKVSTAYALSPNINIKSRDKVLETNVLTQLATLLYEFSSQVCLYDSKTILLEIAASCKLFSGLSELLKKISCRLTNFSIEFKCALASTVKSAYLISVSQSYQLPYLIEQSRLFSANEIGTRSFDLLKEVSIHFLLCEPSINAKKMVLKCEKMGLTNIGQLLQLPYSAIGRRFGKDVLNYLYRMNGSIKDPQVLFQLPKSFYAKRYFVNGLDTIEQMLFPIKAILTQLVGFINIRRVMVTHIAIRLSSFNKVEQEISISLSSEFQTVAHLLSMTRFKLEKSEITQKVETIILQSNQFMPLQERQKRIVFSEDDIKNESDDLEVLLEQLRMRLGEVACTRLNISDNYLPEKKSNISSSQKKTVVSSKRPCFKLDADRGKEFPLWLLAKPAAIHSELYGKETVLNYRGRLNMISLVERIDSSWWENRQSRDYYQAGSLNGIHYWIYFDRDEKQWLVHGVF